MSKKSPLTAAIVLVVLFLGGVLVARVARAQSVVCDPRTGRCVIQGPTATATFTATATATATMTATVDPRVQIEIDREAQWNAYFQWRVDVAASAAAQVSSDAILDRLENQARTAPDRWTGAAYFPVPADSSVVFPRLDIGGVGACFGAFTGRGAPWQVGYCPNVRYRLDPTWAIAFDASLLTAAYDDRGFGLLGFHPGVAYAFAQGARDDAASYAYALAGLDAWLPITNTDITPRAFLGAHAGVGALFSEGTWGVGGEVRALMRGGVGGGDDPLPQEMRSVRLGFELRAPVLTLSFP